MAWTWVNTYEDRAGAQREADEINKDPPERPQDARALLALIAKAYPLCMECKDLGFDGTFMGCGFEHAKAVWHKGGVPGPKGWHAERDRCLLRSWIEAEGCGCDPSESALGTENEPDDDD